MYLEDVVCTVYDVSSLLTEMHDITISKGSFIGDFGNNNGGIFKSCTMKTLFKMYCFSPKNGIAIKQAK